MSPHRIPLPVRFALTLLLAAVCLVLSSHAQTPAALPRIAVLPDGDDKQLVSFADLLTATLSQTAKACELVERAELNRLSQEAEIQNLNATDRPRALARFAKADGLILLSLDKTDPKRPSIVARLSSASSGLIHKSFMLAAEEKDIPEAAKLAADALRFPAERITKAGSPPPLVISLLGLRATVANSPGVAIETALNGAVTHHLSSIAGIAVVERWKLDDIAFERALSEKDMPALTTGTTLVDGSFEITDKVTSVKIRIRTAEKDSGKLITVQGPADDTSTLAKSIATKVAAECGNHAAPTPWDTKAEADAYAKLGDWLLNHKMGREAAQAYESAVALGDDRFETFHNRIFAYVLIAEPNVTAVDTANPSIRWTFSFLGRNLATNPGRFPLALRSINRATTYSKAILETPWPLHASTSKFSYGFNMAVLGCRTLMAAHVLRLHLEYPGEIRVLRNYAASFVASNGRDLEIYRSAPNATTQHSLDVFAGYWSAAPEQAAEHWLDILRPDRGLAPRQMSDRRYGMLSALEMEGLSVSQSVISGVPLRPLRPLIIDWTSLDNTKGEAVWQNVLAQLSASKSLFNQFDSLALAIHTTPWGEAHDKALLALLDFFERKRDLLPQAEGQAFFSAHKFPSESNGFPQGFAERYCGLLETILTTAPDVELPLLSRASVLLGRFLSPHQPAARRLPQASAEKLLQTLNSHAARRAASGKLTNGNTTYETEIRKLTAVIINAYPVLEKPQPANSRGLPANGDAIRVLSLAPVQDENSQVKRHWMLGRGFTFGDLFLNPRILGPEVDAVCMKPDLTRIEIPAVPKDLFHHRFDSSFPNAHSLQPTRNGFLMLSRLGTLLGYDYKERKWSDESRLLPVHLQDIFETHRLAHGYNMAGYTQPTIGLVGDTLYFGAKDSGHTLGRTVNGQYQLIASSHRRPAEHPLDELPPSEVIAFFPGFQGSPYAMLRLPDRCEVHDLDRRRRVATFMFHSRLSFNGNVAVVSNDYMVAVMDPASEKPRCLIRRPPESGWGDRTTQDDLALETTWPWSPVMSGRNVCSGVHGDCLFILKYARGPVGGSRMGVSTNSDDKMNLYCFRPGQREPLEIPLMIDPEALTKFFPKGVDPSSHTSKVEVITESLEMSPAGMFFYIRVENPMALGSRGLAPDLLCVTWKQVDDWLTRHGHPPIGTRSTKGIAPAPR